MLINMAENGGGTRILRLFLEDDEFDIAWRGQVYNSHGGHVVDCSVHGQLLKD